MMLMVCIWFASVSRLVCANVDHAALAKSSLFVIKVGRASWSWSARIMDLLNIMYILLIMLSVWMDAVVIRVDIKYLESNT